MSNADVDVRVLLREVIGNDSDVFRHASVWGEVTHGEFPTISRVSPPIRDVAWATDRAGAIQTVWQIAERALRKNSVIVRVIDLSDVRFSGVFWAEHVGSDLYRALITRSAMFPVSGIFIGKEVRVGVVAFERAAGAGQ